jgi:hypothetical protein
MKRFFSVLAPLVLVLASGQAFAQFRGDAKRDANAGPLDTRGVMTEQSGNLLSKIFDPTRLTTHQTYSFTYSSMGRQSVGIGAFTNTFNYRASDDIRISADVSAVYSPYNTFGDAFTKQFNGIYLSNAQLDWKLGEQTFLTVQYQGGPLAQGYSGYDRFNPFYENSLTPGTELSSSFGTNGWRSQKMSIRH